MNLHRIVSTFAVSTALATILGCGAITGKATSSDIIQSTLAPAATGHGATVIDMKENPNDFSHAVNHIIVKVKEARAANQKVIRALGEVHSASAHARLAELVRQGLKRYGIRDSVIAQEVHYNLLEKFLLRLFPDEKKNFYLGVTQALPLLELNDPVRYNKLQVLALRALGNSLNSLANIANLTTWLKEGVDVRLIDISKAGTYLDMGDNRTAAFVNSHASKDIDEKTYISTTETEGMRLRNLWMAEHLRKILLQTDIVILQTGNTHLGGNINGVYLAEYGQSLHALFNNATEDNIRFLTIFQEYSTLTMFKNIALSGQTVMNNPNTLILRGGNSYWRSDFQLEKEITVLKEISDASGIPEATSPFESEEDFHAQNTKDKQTFREELENVILTYSPHVYPVPALF